MCRPLRLRVSFCVCVLVTRLSKTDAHRLSSLSLLLFVSNLRYLLLIDHPKRPVAVVGVLGYKKGFSETNIER